jgi:SSS family solute:Na+ symporter/sodium/pantothenate symporter
MPAMALAVTEHMPVVGGLILAAPYAAAMSAVAGYLLLMSSSLVRDIYQRNINPAVSPRTVRWISYGTTAVVGVIVTVAALHPPRFLQYIIVFTGAGMGCTFLAPTVLGLYWRRCTRAGALAALLAGFSSVLLLYVLGWMGVGKPSVADKVAIAAAPLASTSSLSTLTTVAAAQETAPVADAFLPVYLFGLDPLIYGLLGSFGLGILVSMITKPLPASHVDRFFLEKAPHPSEPPHPSEAPHPSEPPGLPRR